MSAQDSTRIRTALLAAAMMAPAPLAASERHAADVSVLVQGGPLHGASGLSLGPSSKLYVASSLGREIVVMDKGSGGILERYTQADGVESPEDLAFGPDGALYWASFGTGEVGRLALGPADPATFEALASLPVGASSLAFSPEGRLFVGLCQLGAGLFEVGLAAGTTPRSVREFPGERCGLDGLAVSADGTLVGARPFASELVAIDPASGAMRSVADGFVAPSALKLTPGGAAIVVDSGAGALWRVDLASGTRRLIASIPVGTDGLALDEAGRVFISGRDDGAIHEVLGDGSLREVSPGGLSFIGGLAVLGDRLFVANLHSLFELDATSGDTRSVQKSRFGAAGATGGALAGALTVSAAGEQLVLSSWFSSTVQIYDPASERVVESHTDFSIPMNAVAHRGGVAVAELGSGRVVLERGGQRTVLVSGLLVPTGLVTLGDVLYVADFAAGTLTSVADGQIALVASGLLGPEGLAVNAEGRLLVVESGAGRVSELDPISGERRSVAEGLSLGLASLPGYPPSYAFNGIAVGPAGHIYVAGDVASNVYVITPASLPR